MLLIYELYASLYFFWASFFIALYEFQSLVLWVRFAPLYSFQSFFYSFIAILPSESGDTLHYRTILP
jgi:hypothetical protein